MAESRAQRMQVVLQLAKRQEEAAAQKLSQCREQLLTEQRQLQQLQDYAAQYHQDYANQQSVLAHQLINYSGFVVRLGDLCREQEAKLRRLQLTMGQLQSLWHSAYQKCRSIADLIARLEQEDAQLHDKRQQKIMDEFSAQLYARQQRQDD